MWKYFPCTDTEKEKHDIFQILFYNLQKKVSHTDLDKHDGVLVNWSFFFFLSLRQYKLWCVYLFGCACWIRGCMRVSSLKYISLWPCTCHRCSNTNTLVTIAEDNTTDGPPLFQPRQEMKMLMKRYRSLKLIRPWWPNRHGVVCKQKFPNAGGRDRNREQTSSTHFMNWSLQSQVSDIEIQCIV